MRKSKSGHYVVPDELAKDLKAMATLGKEPELPIDREESDPEDVYIMDLDQYKAMKFKSHCGYMVFEELHQVAHWFFQWEIGDTSGCYFSLPLPHRMVALRFCESYEWAEAYIEEHHVRTA